MIATRELPPVAVCALRRGTASEKFSDESFRRCLSLSFFESLHDFVSAIPYYADAFLMILVSFEFIVQTVAEEVVDRDTVSFLIFSLTVSLS